MGFKLNPLGAPFDIDTSGGSGSGGTAQLNWKFDSSSTAATAPANKYFKYNSATPASVTEIYIDDNGESGVDASNIFGILAAGNKMYIQQADDSTKYLLTTVVSAVDNTGWWTITVTIDDSGTLPGNNKDCLFILYAAGGGGSGDVVGPASATDSALALFDTTTGKLIKNSVVIVDVLGNITGVKTLYATDKIEAGDPGLETAGIDINGTVYATKFRVNDIGGTTEAQQIIHRHSTVLPTVLIGARANSDTSAHADVTNGMNLLNIYGAGYAGTSYKLFGGMIVSADTGTISNTSAPGKLEFVVTPNGSVTPVVAITVSENKLVTFANGISVTGNIAVTGTVDGRDVSTDGTVQDSHIANGNIHIDHTAVSVLAGLGLTGGGTIAANRTLALDINGLSTIAPVAADTIPFYDVSGVTIGKATFTVVNGVLTLANLADVTFTSLANGNTLRYDSGAAEWINTTAINATNGVDIRPTTTVNNQPYHMVIDGAGTNLVVNPSFEVNITDGWTVVNALGSTTNTRDTTEKFMGDASLKIVTSTINAGASTTAIAVTANTQYVFSVYIKGAVGGEQFGIRAKGNISAVVTSNGFFGLADPINTDWSRLTLPWTAGATDTSVVLSVLSDLAAAQTVYVDAVQFEQKNFPADVNEFPAPSSFMSGAMGLGYSWAGTAHNSASSRTQGTKFLAPMLGSRGNFVVRADGSIARFFADAKEIAGTNAGGVRTEPNFPFTFTGNMKTNVSTSGILTGIMNVRNAANGIALHVDSRATTAEGFVISAASITSGSCMSVFAPADLTAMNSANGKFFTFSGKAQNADMYSWYVDRMTIGQLGFLFNKNINLYGGGSMTATARALAGTLNVTVGVATLTGAGTAFLTDFKRGQAIIINNGGATNVNYTIASIQSNTALTLTVVYAGTTNAARTYSSFTTQYRPPMINLEGAYANHGAGLVGDFMMGIWASGGGGQLHVKRSAARGVAVTPTADHDGHGLVTARQVLTNSGLIFGVITETTMISGYTINAYELTPGGCFRISFVGSALMTDLVRTLTWKVKLGGTTILTSTAVQVGVVGTVAFRGVIDIYAPTETTQTVSISIVGKDIASLLPGLTYSVNNHVTTGTVDLRIDQALTVTCQADLAGQVITVSGATTEIL
jgi:hypothetical protein